MKFRNLAFIGLVFGAISGQAQSADLAAPAAYDWNGWFGGFYAGYDFEHSHIFDNRVTTGQTDFDSSFNLSGLEAGLQASWNKQNGNFVWGFAGDIGYNGASNSTPWPFGTSSTVKTDFEGSLRMRAGMARDNVLLYATGGLALADVVGDYYDTGNRHDIIARLVPGVTVGVGTEFATASNWVVGAEVRYSYFAAAKGETTTTDSGWYESNQIQETTARLSFSKHF